MLTGSCHGCGKRRLLVHVGHPCTCPDRDRKHTPVDDDCATRGASRLVVRDHRPCGRHQRPRESSVREL